MTTPLSNCCNATVKKKLKRKRCESCQKLGTDVSLRPNAYANDVGNDPTATHTVCDECDYQNTMDI